MNTFNVAAYAPALIILVVSIVSLVRTRRELHEAQRLLARVRELHRAVFQDERAP